MQIRFYKKFEMIISQRVTEHKMAFRVRGGKKRVYHHHLISWSHGLPLKELPSQEKT